MSLSEPLRDSLMRCRRYLADRSTGGTRYGDVRTERAVKPLGSPQRIGQRDGPYR
jgi:hypothetical protein